ncbi:MAG: hypothetical protein NTV34_17095 [Proteobacteria bacterium]|nr:hypothetical protein [Pseudomonadota bacterium]
MNFSFSVREAVVKSCKSKPKLLKSRLVAAKNQYIQQIKPLGGVDADQAGTVT